MHCANCNINSSSARMKHHRSIPAGMALPYQSAENDRVCLACYRKLTKKPTLKRQLSKVEEEAAEEKNNIMDLELDELPPLPELKEEAAKPGKRKGLDRREEQKYEKKMREIGLYPESWKRGDMVRIDAEGSLRCVSRLCEMDFEFIFKQQIDNFLLPGQSKEKIEFALKHTIAQAANIVSSRVSCNLFMD